MARKVELNPKLVELLDDVQHVCFLPKPDIIMLDITSYFIAGTISVEDFYTKLLRMGYTEQEIEEFANRMLYEALKEE